MEFRSEYEMKYSAIVTGLTMLAAAGVVLGCGGEKKEAMTEVTNVEKACASGERQKALDIMLATAGKNETFRKSFQFATAGVPDKSTVDACGDALHKLKTHLDEN
jgi:hypothetical protein